MLEYNERAFVSRLLIPALIAAWKTTDPERAEGWAQALSLYQSQPVTAIPLLQDLLSCLPEVVTLSEIRDLFPDVFATGARLFPGLFAQAESLSLKVRSRALHHLGEIERVNCALQTLNHANDENEQPVAATASTLGRLLTESHRSLSDLYEVSTSEIEELRRVILQDKKVHGARMMGGGFGGTILTLTTAENVPALIELVQTKFYGSRSRHALQEKAIMVSTPGEGLTLLDLASLWREAIADFAGLGKAALVERARFNSLLDAVNVAAVSTEVIQPIIVAAGGGTRAAASGLLEPKPLALVNGQPAIRHVLENLRAAAHFTRPPIVIVAPENESQMRLALADEEVMFVVQPSARGTGDAVWWTKENLSDFNGLALVVWSTQPVITPLTIKRTLKLATLCQDEYAMIFPTAMKEQPYAPLYRDHDGQVTSSRESHLESARRPDFGETNLGLFVLQSEVMLAALDALHMRFWNSAEGRYERPRGELGFPNELIDYFVGNGASLLACPLADPREEQGIKTSADVPLCERLILELH
jgi:CTP:molybdopterin cytidylyltransferase MocA